MTLKKLCLFLGILSIFFFDIKNVAAQNDTYEGSGLVDGSATSELSTTWNLSLPTSNGSTEIDSWNRSIVPTEINNSSNSEIDYTLSSVSDDTANSSTGGTTIAYTSTSKLTLLTEIVNTTSPSSQSTARIESTTLRNRLTTLTLSTHGDTTANFERFKFPNRSFIPPVVLPPRGMLVISGITVAVTVVVFVLCYLATMMNLCICKFLMHECPSGRLEDRKENTV